MAPPLCRNFLESECKYKNCRFIHPPQYPFYLFCGEDIDIHPDELRAALMIDPRNANDADAIWAENYIKIHEKDRILEPIDFKEFCMPFDFERTYSEVDLELTKLIPINREYLNNSRGEFNKEPIKNYGGNKFNDRNYSREQPYYENKPAYEPRNGYSGREYSKTYQPRNYGGPKDYNQPFVREYNQPPVRDYNQPSARDYSQPRTYGQQPVKDYNQPARTYNQFSREGEYQQKDFNQFTRNYPRKDYQGRDFGGKGYNSSENRNFGNQYSQNRDFTRNDSGGYKNYNQESSNYKNFNQGRKYEEKRDSGFNRRGFNEQGGSFDRKPINEQQQGNTSPDYEQYNVPYK